MRAGHLVGPAGGVVGARLGHADGGGAVRALVPRVRAVLYSVTHLAKGRNDERLQQNGQVWVLVPTAQGHGGLTLSP